MKKKYHISLSLIALLTMMVLMSTGATAQTTYYTDVNGAPETLANWWTGTGGTGTHPANFTTAGDIFIIQNGDVMTQAAAWTVTGTVQINSGGTLARGTLAFTCGGLVINGTMTNGNGASATINGNVSGTTGTLSSGVAARVFNVTGNWTYSGTVTANAGISLNMNGTGSQTLSGNVFGGGTANSALTINKTSGVVTLGSAMNISGSGGSTFTLTAGTFDASTYLLTATTPTLTAGTLRVGAAAWATNYSFTPTPPAGFTIEIGRAHV
jgi:hypothetical protein